ncbi:MAG: arsenate reductase ArsC [Planctomycetota bacterium]
MDRKTRVLFFCVTNSCRSQMAEAWARNLRSEDFEAFSAGARLGELDPRATLVMAEAGVDIQHQISKTLADLADARFDLVISLSAVAHAALPPLVGSPSVLRLEIPNPQQGVDLRNQPTQLLNNYRRVRDQLRHLVEALPTDHDPRPRRRTGPYRQIRSDTPPVGV